MKIQEIKVPDLPESVESGSVLDLHAEVGQYVNDGDLLFEIETDKIVLEVCATTSGKITEVKVKKDQEVSSRDMLCTIDAGAAQPTAEPSATEQTTPSETSAQENQTPPEPSLSQQTPSKNLTEQTTSLEASHLSPSMRKQAKGQAQINNTKISSRNTRKIKMTRMRQKIAQHLLNAQKNAAILTTFNEVNMKPVMDIRAQYKATFQETHDAKLGFMSFFTKACAQALQKFEAVNAYIEGDEIIYHDYQDIGIAISSERGLIVPVLRNTENMSFADIEKGIVEFAKRAKNNNLSIDDLQGGTFTITNGGTFGSLLSTPILNPPQSAILGMHAINQKAWIENDQVVVRPIMMLALSYDHRIIDGREAVLFLRTVKELIEDPVQLMLDL